MAERRQAVKVEVPGANEDGVQFARIGIIAAICFGIGIAWPLLAGVKLVPSVPTPASDASRDLSGAPAEKPPEPAPPKAVAPAPAPSEVSPVDRVVVSEAQIASCRDAKGKRAASCDRVDFDRVARVPLRELGACEGTERASGVLSLGFELDFQAERIEKITSGKSTSLPQEELDRFLACARERFANVSLVGIPHQRQSYSLFYRVELVGAEPAPAPADTDAGAAEPDSVTPASGRATVSWDVALVRAVPNRDGEVRARVLSGTRLVVTGRSGDWFRVKYDARGSQGWVYRTAIGM